VHVGLVVVVVVVVTALGRELAGQGLGLLDLGRLLEVVGDLKEVLRREGGKRRTGLDCSCGERKAPKASAPSAPRGAWRKTP
jgi:hypothetical protein